MASTSFHQPNSFSFLEEAAKSQENGSFEAILENNRLAFIFLRSCKKCLSRSPSCSSGFWPREKGGEEENFPDFSLRRRFSSSSGWMCHLLVGRDDQGASCPQAPRSTHWFGCSTFLGVEQNVEWVFSPRWKRSSHMPILIIFYRRHHEDISAVSDVVNATGDLMCVQHEEGRSLEDDASLQEHTEHMYVVHTHTGDVLVGKYFVGKLLHRTKKLIFL